MIQCEKRTDPLIMMIIQTNMEFFDEIVDKTFELVKTTLIKVFILHDQRWDSRDKNVSASLSTVLWFHRRDRRALEMFFSLKIMINTTSK